MSKKKKKKKTLHDTLVEAGLYVGEYREAWIYIDGHKTVYKIRDNGEVISTEYQGHKRKKPLAMSGGLDKDGYHIVSLTYNKKKYTRKIHRLVAEAFIPNPDNLPEVNHKDGIKLNNSYENLEWVSAADNIHHACEYDLRQSTLTPEIVQYICVLLSTNLYSVDEISIMSGASEKNIYKILGKRTWVSVSELYNIDNYNRKDHVDKTKSRHRLNESRVRSICVFLQNNNGSFSSIARDHDVSINAVIRIYKGISHKNISSQYDFSNYRYKVNQFY